MDTAARAKNQGIYGILKPIKGTPYPRPCVLHTTLLHAAALHCAWKWILRGHIKPLPDLFIYDPKNVAIRGIGFKTTKTWYL